MHIISPPLFKPTFQWGPYQSDPKCKIYVLGPPFNVKLVAERPAGAVFAGTVFKIPSIRCKLTIWVNGGDHRI